MSALAAAGAPDHVVLRPARSEERPRLYGWIAEAMQAGGGEPPTPEQFFEAFGDAFFHRRGNRNGRLFVIERGGRPTGCLAYRGLADGHGWAELLLWPAAGTDRETVAGAVGALAAHLLAMPTVAGAYARLPASAPVLQAAFREAGFVAHDPATHALPAADGGACIVVLAAERPDPPPSLARRNYRRRAWTWIAWLAGVLGVFVLDAVLRWRDGNPQTGGLQPPWPNLANGALEVLLLAGLLYAGSGAPPLRRALLLALQLLLAWLLLGLLTTLYGCLVGVGCG